MSFNNLRTGQRLCIYIIKKFRCRDEDVHRYLFNMSDDEYEEALYDDNLLEKLLD